MASFFTDVIDDLVGGFSSIGDLLSAVLEGLWNLVTEVLPELFNCFDGGKPNFTRESGCLLWWLAPIVNFVIDAIEEVLLCVDINFERLNPDPTKDGCFFWWIKSILVFFWDQFTCCMAAVDIQDPVYVAADGTRNPQDFPLPFVGAKCPNRTDTEYMTDPSLPNAPICLLSPYARFFYNIAVNIYDCTNRVIDEDIGFVDCEVAFGVTVGALLIVTAVVVVVIGAGLILRSVLYGWSCCASCAVCWWGLVACCCDGCLLCSSRLCFCFPSRLSVINAGDIVLVMEDDNENRGDVAPTDRPKIRNRNAARYFVTETKSLVKASDPRTARQRAKRLTAKARLYFRKRAEWLKATNKTEAVAGDDSQRVLNASSTLAYVRDNVQSLQNAFWHGFASSAPPPRSQQRLWQADDPNPPPPPPPQVPPSGEELSPIDPDDYDDVFEADPETLEWRVDNLADSRCQQELDRSNQLLTLLRVHPTTGKTEKISDIPRELAKLVVAWKPIPWNYDIKTRTPAGELEYTEQTRAKLAEFLEETRDTDDSDSSACEEDDPPKLENPRRRRTSPDEQASLQMPPTQEDRELKEKQRARAQTIKIPREFTPQEEERWRKTWVEWVVRRAEGQQKADASTLIWVEPNYWLAAEEFLQSANIRMWIKKQRAWGRGEYAVERQSEEV